MVERAVGPLQSYIHPDFQLNIHEDRIGNEIKPRLSIDLVLRDFLKNRKTESLKRILSARISENMSLSRKFTLRQAIERGLFQPLEVNFVDQIPKAPKPKLIVDRRG
jgi:hypothetical protein